MDEKKKSGFGTAGMVLGIIGICLSAIPIINNIAFILGILASIFGFVSLSKQASKGQAVAGLVLGILSVVITVNSQAALSGALNELGNELDNLSNEISNSFEIDNSSPDKMTLDKFNQIENGMSYEEVVDIVGSEGTLSTESSYGNQTMKIYYWYASNDIANATVTFMNNEVTAKSQIGLAE